MKDALRGQQIAFETFGFAKGQVGQSAEFPSRFGRLAGTT